MLPLMEPVFRLLLAPLLLYLSTRLIKFVLSTQRLKDFPPGPPTLPGLGNLHQMPLSNPFLKFHEWSKTYGDVIGLKLGSENLVILNSAVHVKELWEKRGAIYSGRPNPHVPCKMVIKPGDEHILFLPNGELLQRSRKAARPWVSPAGVEANFPFVAATAAELNKSLLENPENFDLYVKHWSLATPMLFMTGTRLEDEFRERFFEGVELWQQILAPDTAPPVDIFPWLRHVPEFLADWKRKARTMRERMYGNYARLMTLAQAQSAKVAEKKSSGSQGKEKWEGLVLKIMRNNEIGSGEGQWSNNELALLAGGLLEASVDTVRATFSAFLLVMALKTEDRVKAQAEIDAVCEDGRPPEGRDLPHLPYLRACLNETIRLYGAGPLGLPRLVTEDDVYLGYRIPKGTTVLSNVYTIHLNPEEYDNPTEFDPSRFLAHPLGTKPGYVPFEGRRPHYQFGAGRRMCIGEDLAKSEALLTMARVLWAFDIGPVEGEKYDLGVQEMKAFRLKLALWPEPYKVRFTLRSEDKRRAVLEDYRRTQAYLDEVL